MIDFAAITSRLPRKGSGEGGRDGCLPRIAAIGAAAALGALALVIGGAWNSPAHADGGASARDRAAAVAAPGGSGATIQFYAQRILRALSDRHVNSWARYWRARAACDAALAAPAAPRSRVPLALTAALCAQLDALFGVNPADYPPRGDERAGGLTLNEPGAAVGYTLLSVWDAQKVYLIDPLGRVAYTWHIEDAPLDKTFRYAKLLDNGNLMAMTGNPSAIVEIDPRGNVVWRYASVGGLHHDFLKMPNGNVTLLAVQTKTRDQAIAAGANPEFVHKEGVRNDYLVEVRPIGASGGEVVWEWSVWDHLVQDFDPSKPNYGAVAEHPELIDINFLLELRSETPLLDWLHTNAIDYNPELDQIMLSPRHFNELWIIDHSATKEEARRHSGGNSGMGGDLLYRWGNPRAYGHGDADDQRLFWQHNTHWIAPGLPGAGNILLFNNGKEFPGYERLYSSVDELVPPVDGYRYRRAPNSPYPPDELAWTYVAETRSDFYAPIVSGAQRLPNGNTLIVDGTAGTIFQATPDGKAVWKYTAPQHYHISRWQYAGAPDQLTYGIHQEGRSPTYISKNIVHRANWYPPDHPGLQALDLAPGAYLEDTPDPFEWARAAIAAGDFGERLARSRYDIYLSQPDLLLIYFKRPCAEEDTRAKFFLHVFPSDMRDLPAHRQEYGFDNMDFRFGDNGRAPDGWCITLQRLPGYPIERISTGQHVSGEGALWRADIDLRE